jgi:hypothetical protein
MLQLNYPNFSYKIKHANGQEMIFDEIRKRWLKLTPEEWVRQNMIQYLIIQLQYPAALIAVEKEIKLGDLKKRCDVVVYKMDKPWMIIECKAMHVTVDEKVLKQILNYNMTLKVPFIVVTNGNATWVANTESVAWLNDFPNW